MKMQRQANKKGAVKKTISALASCFLPLASSRADNKKGAVKKPNKQ